MTALADSSATRASGRRMLRTDAQSLAHFGDPFRPLEPECKVVQFERPLSEEEFRRAGALVADRPDIQLYVYGRATRDLDFLRHFPAIRRLHIALWELEDIGGLAAALPQLSDLTFGRTRKRFSLDFLETGKQLDRLFLVGHKQGIDAVGALVGLEELGLSGITLDDLSILLPLSKLRKLNLFLGGTKDLRLLPRVGLLEELWLMRITGLADLDVLKEMRDLVRLQLDWMRNVTSLPSLSPLTKLASVRLDTMKGLRGLKSVAAAPGLKRLAVVTMPQLKPEDFACLQGHPSLTELWAFPGGKKVNGAIRAMFPGIARSAGKDPDMTPDPASGK